MWQWINENSDALSVLVSLVTMFVWIAYFHILYAGFKRQRRTHILINRGAGHTTQSRCLISNMGAEPLYIISIIGVLEGDGDPVTAPITDLDESEAGEAHNPRETTSQGPMMSGDYMDVGSFADLMARSARMAGEPDTDVETRFEAFRIIVVAAYGAEDLSVGAERRFVLRGDGPDREVEVESVSTTQLRSRRARRRLERILRDFR
ncbi:hypothetical protein K1T73_02825 [Roseovarius sp. SCSIO 43702]|uniref:hypothetical protein n=1 Tax=Roseovarius sp. SCSIO 43702 TaxID=2823043 RepID=UPI001C72BA65|nr:hypothetical protein [Roseovarius sp. SCSIO 43702]QYX57355.1 hypothetical protein K1T73_02825 [Roseovarius sp. SCSIO 43702]